MNRVHAQVEREIEVKCGCVAVGGCTYICVLPIVRSRSKESRAITRF